MLSALAEGPGGYGSPEEGPQTDPEIRESCLEEGTRTSGSQVSSDGGRSVSFTTISLGWRAMSGKK